MAWTSSTSARLNVVSRFRSTSVGCLSNSHRQHAISALAMEVDAVSHSIYATHRDFSTWRAMNAHGVKRNKALCLGNYRTGIGSSPWSTYPLGIVISSIVTTNTGAPVNPPAIFRSFATRAMPVYAPSRSLLSTLPIQQLSKQNIPKRSDNELLHVCLTWYGNGIHGQQVN